MKTLKKGASLLLVLSMIFSMAVTCAFADDTEPSESAGTDVTEETEQEAAALPEETEVTAEAAEETEPAAEPAEETEPAAEPAEETEPVAEAAEEADPGIQTLADDVNWTQVKASTWGEVKEYLKNETYRSMYLEIVLTDNITWEETLFDFTTMPRGIRLVGSAENQGTTVTLKEDLKYTLNDTEYSSGYMFNSTWGAADWESNATVTMENLTVDCSGNGLFCALYESVADFTLTDVTIRNAACQGSSYGIIKFDGWDDILTLNMTNVTTENCTGALIHTGNGYMGANITNCKLSSTADSYSARQAMIQLTGGAPYGNGSLAYSTISNTEISWSDGSVTDESTGVTTTYSFQSGLAVQDGQSATLTETVLSGPTASTYAAYLEVYGYVANVLDLNGCTFVSTDDTTPIIYSDDDYQSVIRVGSGTKGSPEVYWSSYSISRSGCLTLEIDSALSENIYFDFQSASNTRLYQPTIATAGGDYIITQDDVDKLVYVGTGNTGMVKELTDNTVRFVLPDTEVDVGDAATFKEICESGDYEDSNTVIINLTDDIVMSSTDQLITKIGPSAVQVNGNGHTIKLAVDGAEAGSLSMFTVSMSSKSLTFSNVKIDAGSQQLITATSVTGALTLENTEISNLYGTGLSVTMTSTAGSVTMDKVTCTSCSGTFFSGGNYSEVTVTDSVLSAKALKDGDTVLYMSGSANASRSILTVENSTITMDDSGYSAYGVYTYGRCGLTLDGDTIAVSGSGENTYNVYDNAYYNENYNSSYPYKLTINSCTFTGLSADVAPEIYLGFCGSSSDAYRYSPILHTDGKLAGQPVISLSGDMYIATSGALQDTLYFSYTAEPGNTDPVLVTGEAGDDETVYTLTAQDMAKLIDTDQDTVRTLVLDTESNSIIYARAEEKVLHVKDADELYDALTNAGYTNWTQLVVYLDTDITMRYDTILTSGDLAHNNVIIDGTPETLDSGEANDRTATLTAPTTNASGSELSDGSTYMFTLGNQDGYSLTFRNMTIDGKQQKLASYGRLALTLENVKLQNMKSTSYSSAVIAVTGASGYTAELTMTNVTTDTAAPCSGTLIYLNGRGITAVVDQSTLATTAVNSSATSNTLIYTAAANTSDRSSLTITNSSAETDETSSCSIAINDTESTAGYGLYVNNYWDVTVDGGTVISGTKQNASTRAVYVNNSGCIVNLGKCTFANTDGTDPEVYLANSSYQVHTDGNTQGMLVRMRVVTSSTNTPIRTSGELKYDIKVDFYTDSVTGKDAYLATGEDDYKVTEADARHLVYADETSARTTGVTDDGYIMLYRPNISACDITLLNAAGYEDDGTPYFWADSRNSTITPEVEVLDAKGNLVLSQNYTVEYADNVLPEDAEIGYKQEATVTVTPQEDLIGEPESRTFEMIVPETLDITDPNNGFEMTVSYDYTDGSLYVTLTENGVELTEGVDYTTDFTVDSDRYTLTVEVTGIGTFEGTLEETLKLPGYDSHVFEVEDEDTLNYALTRQYDTILFADDITNTAQDDLVVVYPVTIIGGGYSLNGNLTVSEGADLTIRDLEMNGNLTVDAGATVVAADGTALQGRITVEADGEMTLGDCTVSGGYITNSGTMNVEEDAYLTELGQYGGSSYSYRNITNSGIMNWSGQFDVNGFEGNNVYGSSTMVIYNSGVFNLLDGEVNGYLLDENGEHTGERTEVGKYYGCIYNTSDGELNISGGTITGFSVSQGASSSVASGGGRLIYGGGGVYNLGTINMSGGTITGNVVQGYDAEAEKNLEGGYSNESSLCCGGAVFNAAGAVFNMSGGEIFGNSADLGGGVFNYSPAVIDRSGNFSNDGSGGTFNMTGGTIRDNTLNSDTISDFSRGDGDHSPLVTYIRNIGSEIFLSSGSITTISGGTISGENDTAKVTAFDEDGNQVEQTVNVGIALGSGFRDIGGVNSRSVYSLPDDVTMTISGDPQIDTGILLLDYNGWITSATLTNRQDFQDGNLDPDDWHNYEWTINSTQEDLNYISYLTMDGNMATDVDVTTLNMYTQIFRFTNNTTSGSVADPDLRFTEYIVNEDRDVLAMYPEDVEENRDDASLLNAAMTPALIYLELTEEETYAWDSYLGQGAGSNHTITYSNWAWAMCNHSVLDDIEWMDEIPATCEQYGTIGHFECTFCGAMFADINCTEPLSDEDVLIDPLGHDIDMTAQVDPTCTEDGYTAGLICTRCGMFFNADGTEDTSGSRILDALGHDWVVVDEIPATATTDGQTAYCECARCGEHWTEPEVIPATGVEADESALEVAIEEAQALLDDKDSPYSEESLEALQAAVEAAAEVAGKDDVSQTEVNNALADLLDAVMALDNEESDAPDDTALEIAVESANALLDEEDSPYESLEDLADAVAAANAVLADANASQEDIDDAVDAIMAAIKDLEKTPLPDTSDLEGLIDAAIVMTDSLNESDFTSDSWKALTEALTEAEKVAADPESQEAVDNAAAALQEAISGLEVNATTSTEEDQAALDAVIAAAEKLVESNYTSDSWSAMQQALENAQNVAKDSSATQAEIVEAMQALTQAISDLKAADDSGTKDGFVQEDGEWHYYDNGTRFTGNDIKEDLKKAIDGTDGWYYIVNGKVDSSYTGVSNFSNDYGWWYINAGKVDFSKTSIEQNNYGWWRVVNGKVDFSCNSVEKNDYGWWYVVGGEVQFGYTGVANYANASGWWYVKGGKVDFSKTGIEQNNYGWWRVVNGQVDFSCNSVEQNDYGWWYVVGGKVDFSYTGVSNYSNAYGWWYISKGKVDFSCNSVEQNDYGWWYVLGGKVQFGYTGVANYANAYGWWYINNGKVDFSYTGRATNNYGTWNVVNGKVVF